MLLEHIIEPDFLIKLSECPRNCGDFIKEFSRQSPRTISEFPKYSKFKSFVLKELPDDNELRRIRLEELVKFIGDSGRILRKSPYDGNDTPFNNIKHSVSLHPTDYLVLEPYKTCDASQAEIISIADFTSGIPSLANQMPVNKNINDMCHAVGDFLRLSSHITFVDPYFSFRDEMWQPIMAFIKLSQENSPTKSKNVSIVFNGNREKNGKNVSPCAHQILAKIEADKNLLTSDLNSLSVIAIGEKLGGEKIHNRYIISELGALCWGIGLNEEKSSVVDDLVLLNEELYLLRHRQYTELNTFDVIDRANGIYESN